MKPVVKICGLSSEETLDAALAAGADMVGLNFFPASPRFVEIANAGALAERARGRADVMALTVDMDDEGLAAIMESVKPDWLQFHGTETPERLAEIKKRFKIKVMKAIGIREKSDLAGVLRYRKADGLLLDAKPPKGATRPGGNGAPFDWTILESFDAGLPYLLSGGLDPRNVGEAVRITGAWGVDVSSGVETAPGRKDPDLIRAFIAAARTTASEPERAPS